MPSSFVSTRRVEFCETDMAGIVHFSNFYRWMEQIEHEFFRSLGLSIVHQQSDGTTVGWPRVQAQCRFHAPAHYEDVLTVSLFVQRIGVKSLTWETEFRVDERLIATGSMKTVCCIVRPGEPLRSLEIPPEFLAQIQEHPPRQQPESRD